MKLCGPVISENLASCFSKSVDEEFFPDSFKLANVIALFKDGVKNYSLKYWPISLPSAVFQQLLISSNCIRLF